MSDTNEKIDRDALPLDVGAYLTKRGCQRPDDDPLIAAAREVAKQKGSPYIGRKRTLRLDEYRARVRLVIAEFDVIRCASDELGPELKAARRELVEAARHLGDVLVWCVEGGAR